MANSTRARHIIGILDLAATCAVIGAAALVIRAQIHPTTSRGGQPSVPATPMRFEAEARMLGSQDAEVALIIFSDFQCPACGAFARDTLPIIKKAYVDTGHLRLIFRHLPLAIHPRAVDAAVAAECAGNQKQFWPMHDLLFADQAHADRQSFLELGGKLGMTERTFASCLDDAATAEAVKKQAKSNNSLGLSATPSLYLGRINRDKSIQVVKATVGARQPDALSIDIDQIIRTIKTDKSLALNSVR